MANSQPSTYFFENVRDYFLNDDITIANCENVFSDNDNLAKTDKGEAAALEQYNNAVAEYNSAVALAQQSGTTVSMEKPEYTFRAFWFRSHAATAKLLPENGVDVVSIDNNHTYDFGTDGNMDTRAALDVALTGAKTERLSTRKSTDLQLHLCSEACTLPEPSRQC